MATLSDGIKIKFSISVLFFKITLYFLSILFCETPCSSHEIDEIDEIDLILTMILIILM